MQSAIRWIEDFHAGLPKTDVFVPDQLVIFTSARLEAQMLAKSPYLQMCTTRVINEFRGISIRGYYSVVLVSDSCITEEESERFYKDIVPFGMFCGSKRKPIEHVTVVVVQMASL